MPGLTPVGELEYNGYVFDATSVAKVNVEFVKDDANRTIIYHRHTLTVQAVVAADPQCDDDLETIRMKLGEPRRRLKFTNRGFGGDVDIGGAAGKIKDVKFGPLPQVLAWESLGGNRAASITWSVVFHMAVCDSPGKAENGQVLALNYDTAFAVDKHGDTTRTISGYVEIRLNTKEGRIPQTAEDYLNRILIKPMPGFDRSMTRRTSLDRARCDFTVTDTQIPSRNAYPPGIVVASGTHRVRWARGNKQSATTRNNLSLSFDPSVKLAPAQCWLMFVQILDQRVKAAEKAQRFVLLDELEAEEDIFGRPCSFSASWRTLMCLQNLLGDNGMWQPIGTDWQRWSQSLSLEHDYFGTANLHAASDVIVDICASADSQVLLSAPTLFAHPGGPPGSYANKKPPPEHSYLKFEMSIGVTLWKPNSRQSVVQSPEYEKGGSLESMRGDTETRYPPKAGTDDLIQRGGRPRYKFFLLGHAMRAGYPVPRPTISKIGDATPVESGGTFMQRPVYNALGVPVYHAAWKLEYDSANSPGKVSQAPNLAECIDEQGTAKSPTK